MEESPKKACSGGCVEGVWHACDCQCPAEKHRAQTLGMWLQALVYAMTISSVKTAKHRCPELAPQKQEHRKLFDPSAPSSVSTSAPLKVCVNNEHEKASVDRDLRQHYPVLGNHGSATNRSLGLEVQAVTNAQLPPNKNPENVSVRLRHLGLV